MVSLPQSIDCLKSSMRLSSVVPATVTGQDHKVHELTNMDLVMKLHYIKGLYFFAKDAVEGLTTKELKKPMFQLLQLYFAASGRIRRSGTGRPFINCNDGGVRTVEASCDETIDEWLAMAVDQDDFVFNGLVYNQVLGDPDLGFSPLVFIQFTSFKCGGLSVGLSWANVLGDAISALAFLNLWGKILAGYVPLESHHMPVDPARSEFPILVLPKLTPNALRRIDSVGDSWLTPSSCKMKTQTFHVRTENISHFLSDQTTKVSAFEVISAIIWKSLSKIKENPEQTRLVTVVSTNKSLEGVVNLLSNEMVWSTVEADFLVAEAEVTELVELILNKRTDENGMIKEMMGKSGEPSSDFIAYGANLTFVNLEKAEIYGLELKGKKPVYANYSINGVGDQGVVLVLPAGPQYGNKDGDGLNGDRTVTVVLPENQLTQLKVDLEKKWNIA